MTELSEKCCACGSPDVAYHNYKEQPFCQPCADGEREHDFRDPDGAVAVIRPSADHENAAAVDQAATSTVVPAHRLAEFTRALYAAAGQPVPDLPVIYDPDMVAALVKDMQAALPLNIESRAMLLLDAGWRKS